MIFHHPHPVLPDGNRGSQIRPWRMLSAFQESGWQVDVVAGPWADRKNAWRTIQSRLREGIEYRLVYCESSTRPLLFSAVQQGSLQAISEYEWLRRLRSLGIGIGLYYRDIHWKFPVFQNRYPKRMKRLMFTFAYYWDWKNYTKTLDRLFVPSRSMARVLPPGLTSDVIEVLPPGCTISEESPEALPKAVPSILRLLFVGGTRPPTYDLSPLFQLVSRVEGVHLTVCCRETDWAAVSGYYSPLMDTRRVSIVHASGSALDAIYRQSDIFMLLLKRDSYLDLAMPVKLLESLGHAVPILAYKGTESGLFIDQENIGWTVRGDEDALILLHRLTRDASEVAAKREIAASHRHKHTWKARAAQVAESLAAAQASHQRAFASGS